MIGVAENDFLFWGEGESGSKSRYRYNMVQPLDTWDCTSYMEVFLGFTMFFFFVFFVD
jgi:hypothetical protein